MSISTSRTDLPQKRSRTRTHAMSGPMKTLTTAARGIRTSALNQIMAMPSPSPDDRVSVERGPDRRGVLAGRTRAISVMVIRSFEGEAGGEDGLEDEAVLLVEELRRHLVPAAEVLVDGQQGRDLGERVGRVLGALDRAAVVDVVADRAEAGQRELLLALVGQHEVKPGLRRLGRLLEDGTGVLDLQRRLRNDVLEGLVVLRGQDGLVLVGHEHVAGAAEERGGGVPTAARERDDVLEELVDVLRRLLLGAAVADDLAVGGERVPAGRAGRG